MCAIVSTSFVQAMWYAVSPKDKTELLSNSERSYLLQKLMINVALYDSNLNADDEIEKLESYCEKHSKKSKGTRTLVCPDPDCDSTFSSTRVGISGLVSSMKTHWFTLTGHQPKLHASATALLSQNKREAHALYEKSGGFQVVPFPELNQENEDQEEGSVSQGKRSREVIKSAVRAPLKKLVWGNLEKSIQKPATFFLLEEMSGLPGAFSTLMESSIENLLVSYLTSKQLEGKPLDLESLKAELLQRTKKQQMVQRNVVQSLVCPAQGCKHQCTEQSKQNELQKIAQTLVVHYAAYHKQEHPTIQPIIGLIATNFADARKKLERGK